MLALIEHIFGLRWLKRKTTEGQRTNRWGSHSIPKQWMEAKAVYERVVKNQPCKMTDDAHRCFITARVLTKVQSCPGFDTCILPRLKGEECEKALYECVVANMALDFEYPVSFILTQPILEQRTPDLHLDYLSTPIAAECKKKNAYQPRKPAQGKVLQGLRDRIQDTLNEHNLYFEVALLSLGPVAEKDFDAICAEVLRLAQQRPGVRHMNRSLGCVFRVTKIDDPMPAPNLGLAMPSDITVGKMRAEFMVKDGLTHIKNIQSILIYEIDWHRLSSVVTSLRDAHGQLPADQASLIYIDLDVSFMKLQRIHPKNTNMFLYIELAGEALQTLFTKTENTRIGAVILTAGPMFYPEEDGSDHGSWFYVVRNRYARLPSLFAVPGEATTFDTPAKTSLSSPIASWLNNLFRRKEDSR